MTFLQGKLFYLGPISMRMQHIYMAFGAPAHKQKSRLKAGFSVACACFF